MLNINLTRDKAKFHCFGFSPTMYCKSFPSFYSLPLFSYRYIGVSTIELQPKVQLLHKHPPKLTQELSNPIRSNSIWNNVQPHNVIKE